MEALRPCPFCNKKAEVITHGVFKSFVFYVSCLDQKCHGFCTWTFENDFGFENKEDAIKAWNTRPAEKLVPLDENHILNLIWSFSEKDNSGGAIARNKLQDSKYLNLCKSIIARFGSVPVNVEWPPEKKCKYGSLCGPNGDCENCAYNRGRSDAMAAFEKAKEST